MRRIASVFAVMACVSAVACSVHTVEGQGPGGSSGSGTPESPNPPGSPTPNPPSGPSAKNAPPASTVAAPVELNAACPAFVACNAKPIGTYDYKSGCIGDVFADARKQCPAMQSVGVKADVVGSITFDGALLARDVQAHVSGTLVFPADCTLGQCAQVESALRGAFDTASCTPQAGGCNCAVSKTSATKDIAGYSINGSTLTVDNGDTYEICETGGSFSYSGKSAGAEDGSWSLAKR
jgi:hypothetical protein